MRISDWSSDVCSSDLLFRKRLREGQLDDKEIEIEVAEMAGVDISAPPGMEEMTNQLQSLFANMGKGKKKSRKIKVKEARSEEHTSELQSLMRNSNAVYCMKKKKVTNEQNETINNIQNNRRIKT